MATIKYAAKAQSINRDRFSFS